MQNYEMAFEVLPPGTVNATGPIVNLPAPGESHMSWTVQVMPYMELATVFNHMDFKVGVYDPRNLVPQQRALSIYVCPSDPGWTSRQGGRFASNYAGCHNGVEAPIDVDNDGLLFLNSAVRFRDIPDGSAYTIAVGERVAADTMWGWGSGTRDTLRNCGAAPNGGGMALMPPASAVDPYADEDGDGFPDEPAVDEPTEETTPEAVDAEEAKRQAALAVGGFSSKHTGGAQYAIADGSVRFVSENISPKVYQNLGSRADGEMPMDF